MNVPALVPDSSLPANIAPELEAAMGYAKAEKAPATRRAYQTDFRLFAEWCQSKGACSLPAPPETMAAYLAFEVSQGLRPSTLGRRLAAIRYAHKLVGQESPTGTEGVKATLRGIKRTLGNATVRKSPATADKAKAMSQSAPDILTHSAANRSPAAPA